MDNEEKERLRKAFSRTSDKLGIAGTARQVGIVEIIAASLAPIIRRMPEVAEKMKEEKAKESEKTEGQESGRPINKGPVGSQTPPDNSLEGAQKRYERMRLGQ